MTDAPPPRTLEPTPSLDGLRGLAIAAVLGTHVIFVAPGEYSWLLPGGYLGVDVFLVLSGFLITATLLRERDARGAVDLGRYARRRALRLVPAMVPFFVVHAVAVWWLGDPLRVELRQIAWAFSFLGNWQITAGGHAPLDLVHLWSLAIEAQFYVLLGLGAWALGARDRARPLVVGLGVAAIVVALWRLGLYETGGNDTADRFAGNAEELYQRTDTRADSMLVGALGAVMWRARLLSDPVVSWLGALGALFLGVVVWVVEVQEPGLFRGGFTFVALAAMFMVAAAMVPGSPVARLGAVRPLVGLGRISYSVYLWHLPIYIWIRRGWDDGPGWARFSVAIAASIVVGALSYRFVERPMMGRRRVAPSRVSAG